MNSILNYVSSAVKKIFPEIKTSKSTQINLAKGVYVLQVIGKGNVEYRRIVVE